MEWKDWCDRAVGHVRFRPDRKAIERELTDHYMDHRQDLRRIGYDPELASQRALRAMGDPDEVGRALDRAHRPWLGWLWEVSRVLAALALAGVLWTAVWGDGAYTVTRDVRSLTARETAYETDRPDFIAPDSDRQFRRVASARSGDTAELCGYTLSVPYGAIWRERRDGFDVYWLSAVLTAEHPRFWEDWEYGLDLTYMTLTDSTGREYRTYRANRENEDARQPEEDSPYYIPTFSYGWKRTGLFRTEYSIQAPVWSGGPVDWAELRYPLGEGFTFRLEFEEVGP